MFIVRFKLTLEKTEGAIKNWQSRETGNIGYTNTGRRLNDTKKHNTICVGHQYTQTYTINVNET